MLKRVLATVLAAAMTTTPTAQTGLNYYPAAGYVTNQENDLVSVKFSSFSQILEITKKATCAP